MAGAVIGSLRADLSASIAKFQDDMGKAADSVKGFSKRFGKLGKKMQKIGTVMSAAITAPLALLGKDSLTKFQAQEDAIAAVEAGLKSMGDASGFTSKELQKMASDMQDVSTFGDEDILTKVTANMLTFGNVSGDVFKRASQLSLDLSARLGQDLQSSAIMVGKALNDPVRGLTALTRVGITFSEQQKEQIKQMVAAGDQAGAQALMLEELERQYSGQAEALSKTSKGAMKQLANSWGDFQEQLGQVIAEILPPLVEGLRSVVSWLQNLSPETKKWIVVVGGAAAVIGPVVAAVGLMVSGFAALAPVLVGVGTAITALIAATGPIGLLAIAITGIVTVWQNWDTIGPIVRDMVKMVTDWLKAKLGAVLDWVGEKVDAVTGFFSNMYEAVVGHSYVPDMVQGIADEFAKLPAVMVDPARKAADDTANSFAGLGDRVADSLSQLARDGDFSIKSLVGSLRQLGTEMFANPFADALQNSAGSFLQSGIGSLASSFAGFFAGGGTIPAGQWGVVGENGPELVRGGSGGTDVMPTQPGAGGVTQIFNISTPNADSFRRSERQIAQAARRKIGG